MPQFKPFAATSNPIASVLDATGNHVPASGITRPNDTLLNDPG
jgi:hypothetical protein